MSYYEEQQELNELEQARDLIMFVKGRIINLRAAAIDTGNDSLINKFNKMLDQVNEDYERYAMDNEFRKTIIQEYPEILKNLGC